VTRRNHGWTNFRQRTGSDTPPPVGAQLLVLLPRGPVSAEGFVARYFLTDARGPSTVQVSSQLASRPAQTREPQARRGRVGEPGFYAESGEFHSVRESTPEVNPKTWPAFSGPLAMVARILRHPWFPPARPLAQGRGRGASDMSPVGRRGKPAWGPPRPLGVSCDSCGLGIAVGVSQTAAVERCV
jgi:hypothetical protein